MRLQVLIATQGQSGHRLLDQMQIRSDAIIGNQCGRYEVETFSFHGYDVQVYSCRERGVGLNRNHIWMRANADICLFADDDVRYDDHYAEKILTGFSKHPEADVLLFNFHCKNKTREEYIIPKWKRVRWYNSLRYGTYRIAVRTERVRRANIAFSLLFGGGARYGSGEDCIFLHDCLRHGLKIYACPIFLGEVSHQDSTWFHGYTQKFFHDKGALFAHLFPRLAKPFCLVFLIRHPSFRTDGLPFWKAYYAMKGGIQEYLGKYSEGVPCEKTADLRQQ